MSSATRLTFVCALAVFSFAIASSASSGGLDPRLQLSFLAFMLFEFCVGVYFPCVGVLKSDIVPEQVRGTMYNLYRVPLNAIVVILLLSDISMATCFRVNAALLLVSFLCILGINGTFGPLSRTLPVHA